jgi:MFS family permease
MSSKEIKQQEAGEQKATRGGGAFRALAHRNFRLFWVGAFLSNTGTWMQAMPQGWLVLNLSNSAFWLGFDGFAATAPAILLTPLGGVFADLLDRKRLLVVSQIVAGATALVLAFLIWSQLIQFWMIIIASFVTGSCFALASPSYQAITIDLVGRRDLSNAIALNSAQFQLSRVLGPTLAGLTVKPFGFAGCFLINGLSYVAIVTALSLVRIPKRGGKTQPVEERAGTVVAKDEPAGETASVVASAATEVATNAPRARVDRRAVWRDLKEGFRYVLNRPRVFALLSLSAVTSLFGAPYMTMMPLFARDVFGFDASGLSLLMGVGGAGAFCGAVMLTLMGDVRRKGLFVIGGTFVFGVCLVGFSLSKVLALSLVFLFLIGFGVVSSIAVVNMLLQHLVTDEMRGRVMSMFMLSFFGAFPIGNFFAGISAEHFGAPRTLAAGGAIVALFAVSVAVRNPSLRALD